MKPSGCFFAFVVFAMISMGEARPDTNIAIGKCIVIAEQSPREGSSFVSNDIGCPQDPDKALRVSYFWLDSNSFSLLHQGYTGGGLDQLFGQRPILINTKPNRAFSILLQEFGSLIDDSSKFSGDFIQLAVEGSQSQGENESEIAATTHGYRHRLGQRYRVFDALDPIFMPELDAALALSYSSSWPEGFKRAYLSSYYYNSQLPQMSYDGPLALSDVQDVIDYRDTYNDTSFASDVYLNTVLWRKFTRDDLSSYEQRLREASAALRPDHTSLLDIPMGALKREDYDFVARSLEGQDSYSETLRMKLLFSRTERSRSVQAMRHFISSNFPSDFMKVYGAPVHHVGEVLSWSFFALPRRPYVLVAAIENIGGAGALYDMPGFVVQNSVDDSLRVDGTTEFHEEEVVEFPPSRIGSGDIVVVPLKIALRNHTLHGREDGPESAQPRSNQKLENFFSQAVAFGDKLDLTKFRTSLVSQKDLQSFAVSETPNDTPDYIFGPSLRLNSAIVDGTQWPIRDFDANKTYMIAGFEGGSCPILYVLREGDAEPTKIGRVLRDALGAENAFAEIIDLGVSVKRVTISEEEAEQSHISRIEILEFSNEQEPRVILNRPVTLTLDYGDSVSIELPPELSGHISLRITGYYEPYSELIAAEADRASD